MIYVSLDIAKNKHDCCIIEKDNEFHFSFPNNKVGFNKLLSYLKKYPVEQIKIGLESTGHYSNNLTIFLSELEYTLTILNPLSTNLYRKALTLRKTKTDKIDAKLIAQLLATGEYESYSPSLYHFNELKSLTRHRFRLVENRSKYKIAITRLITVLFPELPNYIWSIHQKSSYAMLLEYPSAKHIANAHLTRLTNILSNNSHGRYKKNVGLAIRTAARNSIGHSDLSKELELKHMIQLIKLIDQQILQIDQKIESIMNQINSTIITIPGIATNLASVIVAEIGDINRFDSPSKLLAFAGLEPSTHQSGSYMATQVKMVKRGSKYLRRALLTAAQSVSRYEPNFNNYYQKKKSEGKHHYVVLSHVAKKLVRVLFHLMKNNEVYQQQ